MPMGEKRIDISKIVGYYVKIREKNIYKRGLDMKIAICDDDHCFVLKFKDMMNIYYPDTNKLQIWEFNSGEMFLTSFEAYKYDIVILDIKMKKLNGLEVAKEIRRKDNSVIIVFLTNYEEFAVLGYEVNAFRYILKDQPEQIYKRQFLSIFHEYHQKHYTFSVEKDNIIYNIPIGRIMYFTVYGRIIELYTDTDTYGFYGILSKIREDERLINFVKPHKSYYVNLAYIDNIEEKSVNMKNKEKIPLSRNYRKIVTERFVSFLIEGF